ncbi:hypothetical protein VTN77DRAFT_5441 [Rasamsonia byssochlamydoides]|uniref:uncharacterized protein n=1 Tax=Rasamsonia byssochlamydoides TaxID=89139 RepID=UPI003742CD1E
MDLVAGVRKEGSRGGRDSFKWEDVKDSAHRENYLGHSIMAPVGRWQKGRDLHWYAKTKQEDDAKAADQARKEREEEIRRIKEAEQEAMARALGLPVAPKNTNPNLTPLGGKEVQKAIQETTAQAQDDEEGRGRGGIGFGSYGGGLSGMPAKDNDERLEAVGLDSDRRAGTRRSRSRSRSRSPRRESKRERSRDRDRGRDRDRDRDRERRRHRHDHDRDRVREHHRHERRYRSRSRSRSRSQDRHRRRERERSHHRRRTTSRSRSTERRRIDRDERDRRRERDYSPDGRRDRHRGRDRDSEYDRRR